MTVINQEARAQYTATSSQTEFTFPFDIDDEDNILVYQRAAGSDPDDAADLLTLTTDYTVTLDGTAPSPGIITLVVGATTGDIVTLQGNEPPIRQTSFTPSGTLSAVSLNTEFDNLVLIYQTILADLDLLTPQYPHSAIVASKDLILPILGVNQVWQMNETGTAIEAVLYDPSQSAAALEAELASHSANEGASMIGLEDQGSVADKSVQDFNEATLIAQTDNGTLPNGQFLAALSTGILKSTTTTGLLSISAPLTSIDGLTTAADKMIYTIGSNAYAVTGLTAAARSVLDDATTAAMLTTLGALPLAGGTMAGDIDMGTNKITNAGSPTLGSDYTTKNYVDNLIENTHVAVNYASTSAYTATYDNVSSGVGATLTNSGAQAAFSIDGATPSAGARLILKDQANALENGVYDLTVEGDGSTDWVATRATDYDEAADMQAGDKFAVVSGTVNGRTEWMMTQTAAITVGTTDITFGEMAQAGALLQSNNLSDVDSASTSRTNLGLDTMATQAANSVAITGGAIDGTTIGGTTPDVGDFTQVNVDNLRLDGNTLSSTDTNGNVIIDPDGTGEIQLGSAVVIVEQYIRHSGDADNQIEFGTDTQDFQTGGSSRLDISDSGVRMGGANSRVTTILDEDDLNSDSPTALATQQSIKAYADNLSYPTPTCTRVLGQTTGNYATTSTSYVDVDATNLTYTVVIPSGYKLFVIATLNTQGTNVASAGLGIYDSVAAALVGFSVVETIVVNVRNSNVALALINGDDASHTVTMQWFTGAGTLTANGAAENTPVMQFILIKSS